VVGVGDGDGDGVGLGIWRMGFCATGGAQAKTSSRTAAAHALFLITA